MKYLKFEVGSRGEVTREVVETTVDKINDELDQFIESIDMETFLDLESAGHCGVDQLEDGKILIVGYHEELVKTYVSEESEEFDEIFELESDDEILDKLDDLDSRALGIRH